MKPDLAVVIVTYNSAGVVEALLDSLPDALDGLDATVVVVDNGSSDATVELLERRSDSAVVRSANVGYAGGINRGVKEVGDVEAILVLNPDVRLEPGCIRTMMTALDRPGVGIVAPQVRGADQTLHLSLRREPSILRALGLTRTRLAAFSEYYGRPNEYLTARPVEWAVGAVLLISRECFDAVDGWDESYFLHSEETDFELRSRDAGYLTWYEPGAVAIHLGQESGYTTSVHCMQMVNRVRFFRRRHGVLATWVYYWLTVANEAQRALRGSEQSRHAVKALLIPSRRPPELNSARSILPR
jgi:N-acetylglucosaminyl-diphospho-decaprenol L-rhamnosyltransferase